MSIVTEKKLYLFLQSALCILLVILLAVSAVSIYREGKARKAENPMEWIYTREAVGEKFKPIAPLFFGAIGMTVAGWILAVRDENADKPVKDTELARNLIVSRVATPSEAMKEEQEKQKKLRWSGWALFLLCMVPIGLYIANGEHFPDGNLEEMIASLAVHTFPWIVLGLGSLMFSTILQEKSMQRETAAAQTRLKEEKETGIVPEMKPEAHTKNPKSKRTLQLIIVIAAVVFIVLGVMNGSAKAVFTKAANICTECVGLG
jgi:predicted anti-sigma-YlaC factor YlaD